jgi:hypothetical protein
MLAAAPQIGFPFGAIVQAVPFGNVPRRRPGLGFTASSLPLCRELWTESKLGYANLAATVSAVLALPARLKAPTALDPASRRRSSFVEPGQPPLFDAQLV